MRYPLVSLNRHVCRVTLIEGDGFAGSLAPQLHGLVQRRFAGHRDAVTYLGFWRGNVTAIADLRYALQRSGSLPAGPRATGQDELLSLLASQLLSGALLLYESDWQRTPPGRLAMPPNSSSSALKSLPALSDLPTAPVQPPLLPALKKVQIEGAEVLPEIKQSLAETRATLATLGNVSASLEPAPNKVPEIKSTLEQASTRLRRQLDEL